MNLRDGSHLITLRALVRNDEALVAELERQCNEAATVAESSALLARWLNAKKKLAARRRLLASEVSIFTGRTPAAAPAQVTAAHAASSARPTPLHTP